MVREKIEYVNGLDPTGVNAWARETGVNGQPIHEEV